MPKIKTELRKNVIKLTVNDSELEQLQQSKTRHHLATWIRENALKKSDSIKKPITIDPDLLRQIARIGNNLNQIAKLANQNKELDIQTLSAINDCRKQLQQIIEILQNNEEKSYAS